MGYGIKHFLKILRLQRKYRRMPILWYTAVTAIRLPIFWNMDVRDGTDYISAMFSADENETHEDLFTTESRNIVYWRNV